jgi:hypothetical protein
MRHLGDCGGQIQRLEDRFPEGKTAGFPINLTMG